MAAPMIEDRSWRYTSLTGSKVTRHYGFPSRQDQKSRKYCLNENGDGFWICASGACHYYSDRKDGIDYEDAMKLYDSNWFCPWLLEGVPAFC